MKRCVYTVLTGGYEALNEQPAARDSGIPFICFTDQPSAATATWDCRKLQPVFAADNIRNQRTYKLLPHRFLPEFDASLYIDNSVLLTVPPERIFEMIGAQPGLALPRHSFRQSVHDVFANVAAEMLDDPERIAEQCSHYQALHPDIFSDPPFWAGILYRDHRRPDVAAAMEIWAAHVYRYARRDQLSINMALRLAGLTPDVLDIDNHASCFHSWPHIATRRTENRFWLNGAEAGPAVMRAEIAGLTQRLAELTYEHEAVLNSTSWRALAPLRAVLRRLRALPVSQHNGAKAMDLPAPAMVAILPPSAAESITMSPGVSRSAASAK